MKKASHINSAKKMKCIYCLENKPQKKYTKREHVIPQCFGRFSPDNLILYESVCDDCNQFFGNNLELFLGRDSYESVERRIHGLEPKQAMQNRRRVKSKIKEGKYKDVIVEDIQAEISGEIAIRSKLQVGFYNKLTNKYVYFEPKDIPPAQQLKKEGFDLKQTIKMFAYESELPQLIEQLESKGVNISTETALLEPNPPIGKVPVESEITLDKTIARAISKIAFNYLAFTIDNEFVIRSEFNGIRQFIRYGEEDFKKYLVVNVPPILHDDQKIQKLKAKTTQGHLINVERRNNAIISKVSPFNSFTYAVILCSNYKGIWFDINSGHHFDLKTKKMSKLQSVNKGLLI